MLFWTKTLPIDGTVVETSIRAHLIGNCKSRAFVSFFLAVQFLKYSSSCNKNPFHFVIRRNKFRFGLTCLNLQSFINFSFFRFPASVLGSFISSKGPFLNGLFLELKLNTKIFSIHYFFFLDFKMKLILTFPLEPWPLISSKYFFLSSKCLFLDCSLSAMYVPDSAYDQREVHFVFSGTDALKIS